ncbi:transglycosylase SLT domain-containing protein [Candidatus Halocynthiibacter alkanivorans]|uniref:transglycosylase SLT domain-containing protein n=1 Tax=Candidatus Halocynthiibacter alkanivorans TaxID=2267619 RepID=UPI000DF449FE|nr:transglycosylase SLT domain-containing protein [Candidatus Halocynthiibacter alkanivorans]
MSKNSTQLRLGGVWLSALVGLLAGIGFSAPALAQPGFCEDAAQIVARESGVPVSVLKAISLNETGRNSGGVMRPWPWTVNMEGKGVWFDSKAEALAYAEREFDRGARSFDIGCFQINYKWHGQAFSSIEEMFDPMANARYAARFLKELYAEKGNWSEAAGAYHSRTPDKAEKYTARFETFRARFAEEDGKPVRLALASQPAREVPKAIASLAPAAAPAAPRLNSFPLLLAGQPGGAMGSLVPMFGSGARRLIAID